jgi:hypothetical protein
MPIMSEEELQRLATAQERGELKVGPISLRDLPKCGSMVAQLTCPLCMSTTEVCAALAAWVQASLDEQQAHADLKARLEAAEQLLQQGVRAILEPGNPTATVDDATAHFREFVAALAAWRAQRAASEPRRRDSSEG